MKYLLLYSFIILLTVSCTRYQYLTVKTSASSIQENVIDQFVMENDTMVVIYDFKGPNLPMGIRVTNKLQKPLFIDWKRSSIIINDKAISLKPDEITNGSAVSGTTSVGRRFRYSDTRTEFSSVTNSPADIEMVPPRSFVEPTPFLLAPDYFSDIPKITWKRKVVELTDGKRVKKKVATFGEFDTPLQFRAYLSFQTEENGPALAVEHSFYLSEIMRSGNEFPRHNRPYVSRMSVGGGVIAGVLAVGLIGVVTIAKLEDDKK